MKKKQLILISIILPTLVLGIVSLNHVGKEPSVSITEAASSNFGQLYNFLLDKEEHYTYSDAFIKEYQQASGGYIDLWKSQGKTVDKSKCEPNQYWHFFESWCKPSIDQGTLKFSAAGSRGYSNFSCPELQLWIMEACGAPANKVEEAYNVAVQGKKDGTKVISICSSMRAIVPWTDIEPLVLAGQPSNPPYHVTPSIDKNSPVQYTMSKFNYDGYQPGEKIDFTVIVNDSTKEISSVTGNDVTITNNEGTYSFTMPSVNVDLTVTLKEKGGVDPVIVDGAYKLVTNLSELIDGAQIIIGTPGTFTRKKAISTTQNANNRSAIDMVYENGYYKVSTEPAQSVSLCVFTVSKINYNSKTYYQFYDNTNKGYLYVTSSSSNYLRTQATNNVNGYFEITNNDGIMNIVASASSFTRNTLGNYSNTFSAYGGGTTTTTINLSIYSDVTLTTKAWATSYMKIGDSSFDGPGSGLCKSNGLFEAAKNALLGMGKTYVTVLISSDDITISSACARYEAWATANGDDNPYGGLATNNSSTNVLVSFSNNNYYLIIVNISFITLFITFIILYRRKYLHK